MIEVIPKETTVADRRRKILTRQDIVTWYTPAEKLPPEDCSVVVTFSGKLECLIYEHCLGIASYFPGEGWLIDGMDEEETDRMTIEAWCDLDAYGME